MRAIVVVVVVNMIAACGFAPATRGNTSSDSNGPVDTTRDTGANTPDARPDALPIPACATDSGYVANPTTNRRYLASTVSASWADAQTTCATRGAYLAVIDDAAEDAYVDSIQSGSFWIGMSDLAQEGTWLWVTGASVDAGYTNWRSGNPNNEGGNQNCGEMDPSGGTWNDYTCPSVEGYVCECPN